MFIELSGTDSEYDLPAPRWSHRTTTKRLSNSAVTCANGIPGKPGPPCIKSRTGFSRFQPRINIHWSTPPSFIFSSESMPFGELILIL
jgi:hypothetical protein